MCKISTHGLYFVGATAPTAPPCSAAYDTVFSAFQIISVSTTAIFNKTVHKVYRVYELKEYNNLWILNINHFIIC